MSLHLAAKPGEIAPDVIISGDPLRIKHMAKHLLVGAKCINKVRGMLGYTGLYNNQKITMLGTGIGIPSTMLFIEELINHFGVKTIIRAGTIGGLSPKLALGDLVIAQSASTDTTVFKTYFGDMLYAPTAPYRLLQKAVNLAQTAKISHHVGQIFSTDVFYSSTKNRWQHWIDHGILGVEMETAALYTLAARYRIDALSVLTVSDNIITGASEPASVREKQYLSMFKLASDILLQKEKAS